MNQPKQDLSVFCLRARTFLSQGRIDDALGLYGDVLQIDPGNGMAYADRGTAHAMNRQFELALDDLKKALACGYTDATVYSTLGTVFYELKQFDAALENFAAAIERNPSYPITYYNRSNVLHDMGNNRAAIADLEKCLSLGPDANMTRLIDRRLAFFRGSPAE